MCLNVMEPNCNPKICFSDTLFIAFIVVHYRNKILLKRLRFGKGRIETKNRKTLCEEELLGLNQLNQAFRSRKVKSEF